MQGPPTSPDPRPRAGAARWRLLRRLLVVGGMVLLGLMLWRRWDHASVLLWMQEAGPVPFFAAMAVLPALGAPMTPFFILAGATFGVTLGLVGTAIALPVNFALCYWIARSGLRPWIERALRRFGYALPNFDRGESGALRFTVLVKLAPGVPAFVKSYLLGLAGVGFVLYLAVSMLVSGVYAAAFVVLGESLLEQDVDRSLVAVAVIVAAAAGLWWWRRRSESRPDHD